MRLHWAKPVAFVVAFSAVIMADANAIPTQSACADINQTKFMYDCTSLYGSETCRAIWGKVDYQRVVDVEACAAQAHNFPMVDATLLCVVPNTPQEGPAVDDM